MDLKKIIEDKTIRGFKLKDVLSSTELYDLARICKLVLEDTSDPDLNYSIYTQQKLATGTPNLHVFNYLSGFRSDGFEYILYYHKGWHYGRVGRKIRALLGISDIELVSGVTSGEFPDTSQLTNILIGEGCSLVGLGRDLTDAVINMVCFARGIIDEDEDLVSNIPGYVGKITVSHSFVLGGNTILDELPSKLSEVISTYNLRLVNKEVIYYTTSKGNFVRMSVTITFNKETFQDRVSGEAVEALRVYLTNVEESNICI